MGQIDRELSDLTIYDYHFAYLHLCACRMLQGYNADTVPENITHSGFKESWLELRGEDFKRLAYNSIDEVILDLHKLQDKTNILNQVPETMITSFRGILVQKDSMVPFTERVKAIIEHPVFTRLKDVTQLDLADSIYPTARHTRYEHSLGVFYQAILMVNHLYNDYYNPLFRQLCNEYDIKKVILFALLHDIAQYPFSHTIEEALPDVQHENFTALVLRNPTQDSKEQTLREIIENKETGWGIEFEDFVRFISKDHLFEAQDLKNKMLRSIVDGPVDADKLDYLVRDSRECCLPYGDCIDLPRLLRNLTIVMDRDSRGEHWLKLAVYDKGATASESVSFARYLLYRSVYWHHTARALRAMVNIVVQYLVADKNKKRGATFTTNLRRFLGFNGTICSVTHADMLEFLHKEADDKTQEIVAMLRRRDYYKLLYDFDMDHDSTLHGQLLRDFRRLAGKKDFNLRLQNTILEKFRIYADRSYQQSSEQRAKIQKTIEILQDKVAILTDAPPPSLGSSYELKTVPVPKNMHKNYNHRDRDYGRTTRVWQQVHNHLMDIAASARVFCHPEIRETLLAVLGPENIRRALEAVLQSQ